MDKYLVLDIGGSSIKYGLLEEDGTVITKDKYKIKNIDLDTLLADVKHVADIFAGEYKGIAVSMPGRIDTPNGIAHSGGVFEFIIDIPFAQKINEMTGVPVIIANDANCAARAELDSGALQGCKGGACLICGTSIGGALALNGEIWLGSNFAAGEAAWLPLDLRNIRDIAYSDALHAEGMSGEAVSTMGLMNTYQRLKGEPLQYSASGGAEFFDKYNEGEPEAIQALQLFSQTMAAEIFSIQAMLDLDVYAIGGGISNEPEITNSIRREVDYLYGKYTEASVRKPQIVTCKYGSSANLYGALGFYLDEISKR